MIKTNLFVNKVVMPLLCVALFLLFLATRTPFPGIVAFGILTYAIVQLFTWRAYASRKNVWDAQAKVEFLSYMFIASLGFGFLAMVGAGVFLVALISSAIH